MFYFVFQIGLVYLVWFGLLFEYVHNIGRKSRGNTLSKLLELHSTLERLLVGLCIRIVRNVYVNYNLHTYICMNDKL